MNNFFLKSPPSWSAMLSFAILSLIVSVYAAPGDDGVVTGFLDCHDGSLDCSVNPIVASIANMPWTPDGYILTESVVNTTAFGHVVLEAFSQTQVVFRHHNSPRLANVRGYAFVGFHNTQLQLTFPSVGVSGGTLSLSCQQASTTALISLALPLASEDRVMLLQPMTASSSCPEIPGARDPGSDAAFASVRELTSTHAYVHLLAGEHAPVAEVLYVLLPASLSRPGLQVKQIPSSMGNGASVLLMQNMASPVRAVFTANQESSSILGNPRGFAYGLTSNSNTFVSSSVRGVQYTGLVFSSSFISYPSVYVLAFTADYEGDLTPSTSPALPAVPVPVVCSEPSIESVNGTLRLQSKCTNDTVRVEGSLTADTVYASALLNGNGTPIDLDALQAELAVLRSKLTILVCASSPCPALANCTIDTVGDPVCQLDTHLMP